MTSFTISHLLIKCESCKNNYLQCNTKMVFYINK